MLNRKKTIIPLNVIKQNLTSKESPGTTKKTDGKGNQGLCS